MDLRIIRSKTSLSPADIIEPPIAAVDIVKNHLIAKHGIKGKYRSLYSAVFVIL
jgi:hypothetical protein